MCMRVHGMGYNKHSGSVEMACSLIWLILLPPPLVRIIKIESETGPSTIHTAILGLHVCIEIRIHEAPSTTVEIECVKERVISSFLQNI